VSAPRPTLLLAWGNPGRRDDGLGPALAERVSSFGLAGLTVEVGYQLQIEDAETVARFPRVVFVDANRAGPGPFRIERLVPRPAGVGYSSHGLSPAALLALSADLFGARPEAWLVGIRGHDFDGFGEGLSEPARENLAAAAAFLRTALSGDAFDRPRPARGAA
jgi:hydrogenase maturation protease